MNEDCDTIQEICSRIGRAKDAFMCMRNLFINTELSVKLQLRMMRCHVFPLLLYGCESWTLDVAVEHELQAFELCLCHNMLRIPWIRKVINKEVLCKVDKSTELISTVEQQKLLYLGYVLRTGKYKSSTHGERKDLQKRLVG